MVLLSAYAGFSQEITPPIVPITQEPSHHLLLENEYVRVFNVEVAPHFTTRTHQHDYDYIYVTLGDSRISNEKIHAEPVEVSLKDGETHIAAGKFAHKVVNLADTPFRNITIEFLNRQISEAGSAASTQSGGTVLSSSGKSRSGQVAVQQESLGQGEVNACTSANATLAKLLVPVSELLVRAGQNSGRNRKPGEVIWLDGGNCPIIARIGDIPARYVLISFPAERKQK